MLPVIAIVGRPNVGKSTLFNCLTQSRDALVADVPGLTRDRLYGKGQLDGQFFIVIDTGGLTGDHDGLDGLMAEQTWVAIREADKILFLVDGRTGLNATDEQIAKQLRRLGKTITLVVNKIDGVDPESAAADFYRLGFGQPQLIAAAQRRGIQQLLTHIVGAPVAEHVIEPSENEGIKIAIVGRPNVGKSTLVNRMLGEERTVVFDMPGTTRDSLYIPLERRDIHYTLIDTAGVRRRGKIDEAVEKFSVVKTLQAVEDSHVVILVLDAKTGIVEQDLGLLGFILDSGRALVIAVNKWDGLTIEERDEIRSELHRRLTFVDFAKIHFISALHGSGVGDLFGFVDQAYESASKKLSTPLLTRILEEAIATHQPPLVRGRRIKLRYAHAGGHHPPIIVIHGNQTSDLPMAYRRFLATQFIKGLKLVGTPVRIELKDSENPFKGRRNTLTPRQLHRRQRMLDHGK
jgi:GTP-binding protein